MKTFILPVILLGLATTLSVNNRSIANESVSKNQNLIVAQAASNEQFIARGTEPFWSVTVSKRGIVYNSPGTQPLKFPYVGPLKAEARPADLVRVYRLKGTGNNTLILKKVSSCSDGMSDINYPYSAIFIQGNKVLEGCAEKK